jgi:predicted DNA-binding transcriptional regulator AlpA
MSNTAAQVGGLKFLVDEREAAALLGLTPRTMQAWRHAGEGPTYVRISARCVRYRVADLEEFAASRLTVAPSSP